MVIERSDMTPTTPAVMAAPAASTVMAVRTVMTAPAAPTVMAGLDPAIYRVTLSRQRAAIDGRVKPGHDSRGGRCGRSRHDGRGTHDGRGSHDGWGSPGGPCHNGGWPVPRLPC